MIKKITRKLMYCYYAMLLLAVAVAGCMHVLVYYQHMDVVFPLSAVGQTIQSCVIAYMLVAIPSALFFVATVRKRARRKKWAMETFLTHYYRAAFWRIIMMGIGLSLGIFAYYVLHGYSSMLFCAGIAAIGLIFSKPNARKIELEISGEDA